MRKLLSIWQKKDGASAIEYGLMVGLITLAIAVAVNTMGKNLSSTFSTVAKTFDSQTGNGNTGGASAGGGTGTGTAAGTPGKTAQPGKAGKAGQVGSSLKADQIE